MRTVCVFCGSVAGADPDFAAAARGLGRELVRRGLALVYGGGRVGLMGEAATAVTAAGGTVVGVIPEALSAKEIAYAEATELIVVRTMHERKALMADRADAFVALPGGFGTLDELFEILTWGQLGIHRKPVGLLDVNGFFSPLLRWLDSVVAAGLLKPKHRDLLLVSDSVPDLLDRLAAYTPPAPTTKWVEPDER
ncbi:MAG: TIGR00730 family Rossman fold protein [Gemmataceae bacterium]|nr:TIGR00730 family Rossman fold protein [Gemmataceae bacterium]